MTLEKIVFPDELTVKTVSALKDQLDQSIIKDVGLELDLENIARIDALGVQLLVTFISEIQRQERPIHWGAMSSALEKATDVLGIDLRTTHPTQSGS